MHIRAWFSLICLSHICWQESYNVSMCDLMKTKAFQVLTPYSHGHFHNNMVMWLTHHFCTEP